MLTIKMSSILAKTPIFTNSVSVLY